MILTSSPARRSGASRGRNHLKPTSSSALHDQKSNNNNNTFINAFPNFGSRFRRRSDGGGGGGGGGLGVRGTAQKDDEDGGGGNWRSDGRVDGGAATAAAVFVLVFVFDVVCFSFPTYSSSFSWAMQVRCIHGYIHVTHVCVCAVTLQTLVDMWSRGHQHTKHQIGIKICY